MSSKRKIKKPHKEGSIIFSAIKRAVKNVNVKFKTKSGEFVTIKGKTVIDADEH